LIGSVERGERDGSILNVRLLARVLHLPFKDLFGETREQTKD
jgi:hypothetical protein